MMFQLNPSKEWVVNQNIFVRQGLAEPKFPAINYFGNRKVQLKTT